MIARRVVLPLLLVSWLGVGATSAAQGPPRTPPPPEVSFITVEPRSVPVSFDYVALTEASKVVDVRARLAGFLDTREFQEGAFIEEGTTLFRIDPRDFKADLEIAIAQVEQAEAELRLADQEVKRLQSVTMPGAIAQTDLDTQLAARANAAATLHLAKATRDKAELQLSYTVIEAPLTGYIGKALQNIGSYVDSGQNSLLAQMQQVDPIYVSFPVSEQEYLAWENDVAAKTLVLSEGTEPYVEITLLDGTTYKQRGTVNFESPSVNTQTGTVEFRGTFENPDHVLKPGQYVKAHVRGWVRGNALTVPQRAVGQSPQGSYVYIIGADNKAETRIITPGEWTGQDWIVKDGLQPGERAIVEGQIKVQPGVVVKPTPFTEEPEPAGSGSAQP